MNRYTVGVHKRLSEIWRVVHAGVKRMHNGSDVRPADAGTIFRLAAEGDGEIACDVGPVVFKFPERATHGVPRLYIAVSGRLVLQVFVGNDEPLRIMSFGTRVGYFRQKDRTLEHVYGVHYDCAHQQIGHPLFHAQMGPQGHFAGNINGYFRQNWQLKDYITPVLRTVRSPSAEMDVFSVFVQICADHLMWEGSGTITTDAFAKIRDSCGLLGGVAEGLPDFQTTLPCRFRSARWYS